MQTPRLYGSSIAFSGVLDGKDSLLAAASCPKFRLRWQRDEARRELVRSIWQQSVAPQILLQLQQSATMEQAFSNWVRGWGQPLGRNISNRLVGVRRVWGWDLNWYTIVKHLLEVQLSDPMWRVVEHLWSDFSVWCSPLEEQTDERFEKLLLMRCKHCFSSEH